MADRPTTGEEGGGAELVRADARLLEGGGARATYVAHRRPGEWFFAASGFLERRAGRTDRVSRARLVADDPSLAEIADLAPGWHAFRATPDEPWWSSEIPTGEVYLLSYEARPTELLEDRDGIGGAFVSCWIVSDALAAARERARKHLEQSGWAIVNVVKEQPIRTTEVPADVEPYYRQAQVDGEVYVIHAFPPEEPDA
jgi:hypothetical protein